MTLDVEFSDDPAHVLAEARFFLAADPVRNNLILTLLSDRVAHPEPGRYWMVRDNGLVVGVAFQSPCIFPVTVSPMPVNVVRILVDAIRIAGAELPGVSAEAATAAAFAGQWTEVSKCAAIPIRGLRIYEVQGRCIAGGNTGCLRQATVSDRELILSWAREFQTDTGSGVSPNEGTILRKLSRGQFYLWDTGQPASMAALSTPVEGVTRVQFVYTPPNLRNNGYAASVVAHASNSALDQGLRCILYTNLGNPVSNSIYRRIGYKAVAEGLQYRFDPLR